MNRLLIFGGGFVGSNLACLAQRQGWEVTIADYFYRPGLDTVQWKTVDITQAEGVAEIFTDVQPQAVVNVAAIANIDQAEQDKDLAWKVNVDGARLLAENCAVRRAKYIFFSSDAVFDGQGQGYTEEDVSAPVNYYGVTKAEAEKAVLLACPTAVVIRISLVLGFPVTGGNSFFSALEGKLKEGKDVPCPPGEIRTPVDVLTLSECVLELARSDFSGRLHIGATDSLSRYELTQKVARSLGYDETLIKLQDSAAGQAGRAPRHQNGIICVTKAQRLLATKLLSTDEGIRRAIQERI